MLDKNVTITLTNRSRGAVIYSIPDLNLRREYQPNETKEITMDELRKLSYTTGGTVLLRDYFVIGNKKAVEETIPGGVEPEYYYTKEDIIKLLTEGSIDQFLDTLDFASEGVLEMIKEYAVKLNVNDIQKRDAIKEKLGFDVTKAIEINKETSDNKTETKPTGRRVAPIKDTSEAPVQKRRVVTEK